MKARLCKSAVANGLQKATHFFPTGIYCFDPAIFKLYTDGETFLDIKEQLLPRILDAGMKVSSCQASGSYRFLYSLEDYMQLNQDVLNGAFSSFPRHKEISHEVWSGKNVRIGKNVTFIGPIVIGDNTIIKDHAQIVGPTSIGANCVIGKKSTIRESTIWNNSQIGDQCKISHSIIARDANIGAGRQLAETVIVENQPKPATINLIGRKFKITTIAASKSTPFSSVSKRRFFAGVKRSVDLVLALTVLALLLPVMGILAIAIKLDSQGPVLFRQKRCGLFGKEFTMFKFRSMVQDADKRQDQLKHLNQVDGPVFKIEKDPRTTRIGRILRKLSLRRNSTVVQRYPWRNEPCRAASFSTQGIEAQPIMV